ncbi:MAG: hypothetical protein EPN60_15530 [Nevskiaceae bacterium]|nr:MAG: hypothetical protein EPO48_10810 [Nevskiaceae bacterium]TAM23142.1 MAG: hypothetical protein EPN60_15530 [Nevskiaceae bacterium]
MNRASGSAALALRWLRVSLCSALLAFIVGVSNLANADDIDIYANQTVATDQAPLTVLVLDLNLLNLNSLVCHNVLLSNEPDCIALRQLLTFQQLFNILGVPMPLLVGLDPLGLLGDLANSTLSVLDTAPALLQALLGNVVGVLVGTIQSTLGSVLGPLNPLDLANNPALALFVALQATLEPLVNTRVALMLFHGDQGPAGGACAFADLASLPGERQTTPGCSNGAYFFLGLINLVSVTDLLTKLVPQVLNVVGNLLTGGATSGNLISGSPYQTKEAYVELARYLRGDRIFNAPLDANDNLLTGLLVRDTGLETTDSAGYKAYKGGLKDYPQACTINMLHVQLTAPDQQDDSDVDLLRLFPLADRNGDGQLSLAEVVDSAATDGFIYGGAGDRRKINSYFLVQDSIGNLADLSALKNLGYNVSTYTNLLGLAGRGQDISGSVVSQVLSIDASLQSTSIGSSSSSATGLSEGAYVAEFHPDPDKKPNWAGNLKRLRLHADSSGSYQYYDANGQLAFASDGRLQNSALTYWTDPSKLGSRSTDGRVTTLGGAGQNIPGYQLGGGGSPGRANPTGTSTTARKLFYDSYAAPNAGNKFALTALHPDDTAVRSELISATAAEAYESPVTLCQSVCNSNASLCNGLCSTSQSSCNNLCNSNQGLCELNCDSSQSLCNSNATSARNLCNSNASTALGLCQLSNNIGLCQTNANTAYGLCKLPHDTNLSLCTSAAGTARSTCTLPHDTALSLCQTNAGLALTLCNLGCLLGNSSCLAACTTTYNNSMASCSSTYDNNTAGCNATYNSSITSCNDSYNSGIAGCTSTYNNSLTACTSNYNNCTTSYDNSVAACTNTYDAAATTCSNNFSSCNSGCGSTGSSCGSSCDANASSCASSCASTLSSCTTSCGTSSSRSADTVTRELLLYARGYDVGTQTAPKGSGPGSSPTNAGISGRSWLLGPLLHSRPLAVNYGKRGGGSSDDIRVLFGSGDGYLRMVRDDTGVESWGFMPQAVMGQLKLLRENQAGANLPYGVDGSPVVLIRDRAASSGSNTGKLGTIGDNSEDRVLLFFGLRRGGSHYYAMDITNPDAPAADSDPCNGGSGARLLWSVGPEGLRRACTSGVVAGTETQYADLGLTYSTPQLGRMRIDADGNPATTGDVVSKSVLIFGGGYNGGRNSAGTKIGKDLNNSRNSVASERIGKDDGNASSSRGNALFIVDAETGALLWRASRADSAGYTAGSLRYGHPLLVDSIPSDVTALDTNNDGYLDRLYVGDTGGRLWRADLPGSDRSAWTLTPLASVGRHAEATPTLASDRRIFNAPDYVPVRNRQSGGSDYDVVLFATGDREDPLNTTTQNWFYAYRDTDVVSGKTSGEINTQESQLSGARHSAFTDQTTACASQTASSACKDLDLLTPGYRFLLGNSGEKAYSAPLTIGGVASFSTYVPPQPDDATCVPLEGSGRLYNISLRDSRPKPAINQIGSDRSTPLPAGGLPGEVTAVTSSTQAVSGQLQKQAVPPRLRASWRERLGEN